MRSTRRPQKTGTLTSANPDREVSTAQPLMSEVSRTVRPSASSGFGWGVAV
jgi:hypothetical protein